MATVYTLNRGINRPLEFRGLIAQYIGFLAAGLVGLLLSFTVAYLLGVPVTLCLAWVFSAGTALFVTVFRLSRRYGRYGLMKRWAQRRMPSHLRLASRRVFLHLQHPKPHEKRH